MKEMEKFYIIEFDNNEEYEDFNNWDFGFFFKSKERAEQFLKQKGYISNGTDTFTNPNIKHSTWEDEIEFGANATIKCFSSYEGVK